jgi:ABC-type dipeptide/oligopeptide/nickel transport system ATPase component
VGESGSGKSQTFLSAFGLTAHERPRLRLGEVSGPRSAGPAAPDLDGFRGRHVAFVFQDPLTALTPHLTIETQMGEVLAHHFK